MTQQKKPKVFWKASDIEKIVAHLVATNIHWNHPNIIPLVRQAQTITLPPEKHRWVQGMASIKMIEKPLNEAWHMYERQKAREAREKEAAERREAEERERQAAEAREAEARALAAQEEAARQAALAAEAVKLVHPLDQLLNALAQEVAGRFTHFLREHIAASLGEGATDIVNSVLPKSEKLNYVRRKKVAVVAVPKNNETRIKQEYPELDIRTINADYNDTRNAIASVDTVVGMIDFMSHSQKDILVKHPHFIRVNGGLDSLRNILNSLRNQGN